MNGLRVVAVVVMCAALCAKAESPQEVARPVRYCDLVRDAARYDGQLVETTAFMRVTFEVMTLSAPECDDLENIAWFEFAPQYVARTRRETREELHRRLGDGRVLVTIRGVFHGPRAAVAPPGLSGPVADAVRKSRSRYGPGPWYRVMIEVVEVVALGGDGAGGNTGCGGTLDVTPAMVSGQDESTRG
ncbi:MAG: hypothetical protein ABFD84_17265 [Candidatus Polarisedimenticolia bacterium]